MDEEKIVREETQETQEIFTKQVKVKKLRIGPLIFIIFVVLIIIGCSTALFAYNRFINDPTKIFTKAINSIYDGFHDYIKDAQVTEDTYFNTEEESVSIEADIKVDGTFMNFNQLKDNLFKVYYGIDDKNDLMILSSKVQENDTDLIDGTFYFQGDKGYIESNTLFNNIYSMNLEEEEKENNNIDVNEIQDNLDIDSYSINDLDKTVKELKDALIASLDKDSMSISKEKIEVNDEKIEVNKISYKLNKESAKKLFSSLAQIVLDNEELVKNLSKILEVEKDKLIEALKEMQKDSFYDDFTNEDNTEFIIYTTGLTYKFVKAEILQENLKLELINYKDLEKITISDFKNNGVYEITSKTRNGIETITITYNKEQILKLIIKENSEDKLDIEFEIKSDDAKYKGRLIVEIKSNSDTEASASIKYNCDITSKTGSYDLKLDANLKVLVGTKIEANKLDKAIDVEKFKDEDTKKVVEVLKNIENSSFFKYFLELFGYNNSGVVQNPTI